MLWFNYILGSNFISFCSKFVFIHYNTRKKKKIKFELRIKLYHNIYIHAVQIKDIMYRPITKRFCSTITLFGRMRECTFTKSNLRSK